MRTILLLTLAACLGHAAVLRGSVVENQTGHPLARALVTVEPFRGGPGPRFSMRTNSYGIFEFAQLPPGSYLVTASRRAFATTRFGQKRWRGAGAPIELAEGDSTSISIRLPRFAAITGTLIDENDVGLADQDVLVYRNSRPPYLLARAKTDDRGMYRFFGLEPGLYLVRTMTRSDDEGTYLPTFYRDVAEVDQARPVEVGLDQEFDNVNIRPTTGRLFSVAGRVVLPSYGLAATVSLISDTGTETKSVESNGSFQFPPMAPGQYEIVANVRTKDPFVWWQPLSLERDTVGLRLNVQPLPSVRFVLSDIEGHPVDSAGFQLFLRSKNLASVSEAQTVNLAEAMAIPPGRYDVALAPAPNYYVSEVSGANGRADGWNEIVLAPGTQNTVKLTLSRSIATIQGVALRADGTPAANMPVYLEPWDLEKRKRLADVRIGKTDDKGQYSFTGLRPALYRVMGTYDYESVDAAVMDATNAKQVNVQEPRAYTQDLEAYVIR